MYFDTHCHLNSETLYSTRHEIVNRARENGVTTMCVVGYDLASSIQAVDIAHEFEGVYAVVGIGPQDCLHTTSEDLMKIDNLLDDEKVVALGEIGLDYYWDTVPKIKQLDVFKAQLELAKKHDVPVVIHSRDALNDTYEVLAKSGVKGIMHCYSGSVEMAKRFVQLGYYISLAGPVTFKNARVPKEVAGAIPLEYLLVETDSPYMAPTPLRGTVNEPKNVMYTAGEVAKLKNLAVEEVAQQTTKNAFNAFKIQ